MAELRSSDVLAKTPAQSRVLCLLDKVCPTQDTSRYTVDHNVVSYIAYNGLSHYHAYSGYVYKKDGQIDPDKLIVCTYQGSGWTFTSEVDDYNRISLFGKGPTTDAGSGSVKGTVEVSYYAATFDEYIIPCHLPRLHNYMCSLVKCVCGDFVLTNSDVVLADLSTITLSTEDKSYKINLKLDFANQTISFHTDSTYDQSASNWDKLNNKYFKTHLVSLYLYTIPVYYM